MNPNRRTSERSARPLPALHPRIRRAGRLCIRHLASALGLPCLLLALAAGCEGVKEHPHQQATAANPGGAGGPAGPGGGLPIPTPGAPPTPAPPTANGSPSPSPPAAGRTDAGSAPAVMPPGSPAPGNQPPAAQPGSPPLTGPGVVINGVAVPKDKVIVLLHIGHSNMAGRAKDPASEMPYFYDTDPHLWQYQAGGVWKPAREPLCPDGGTPGVRPNNQGAGPGMALLHSALALAPDAYIVSIGLGRSLDYQASCFTFRKGGVFYDPIISIARELKGKVTFGGVFTMFSYDGRRNPKAANGGFIDCLAGLAAEYRADLGEPDLPFVVGDYERGASQGFSPDCCGAPQVIEQLKLVPTRIPHSFLIPTDGVSMQDDHHYNMAGHHLWADRALKGMSTTGLAPWATAVVK
jgi:hypothetical protein